VGDSGGDPQLSAVRLFSGLGRFWSGLAEVEPASSLGLGLAVRLIGSELGLVVLVAEFVSFGRAPGGVRRP